jgi:hypothetical protein
MAAISSSCAPQEFICPLTLDTMTSPVMSRAGHSFERRAILEWLKHNDNCPLTRQPLTLRDLVPNARLAQRIKMWRREHGGHVAKEHQGEESCFDLCMFPANMLTSSTTGREGGGAGRRSAHGSGSKQGKGLLRYSSSSLVKLLLSRKTNTASSA